jgi:hypothetical protein
MEKQHYFELLKEAKHKLGKEAFKALIEQVMGEDVHTNGELPCPQGYIRDLNGNCIKDPGPGR